MFPTQRDQQAKGYCTFDLWSHLSRCRSLGSMITESRPTKPAITKPIKERRKRPSADRTPICVWEPKSTRLRYGYDLNNEAGVNDGRYVACASDTAGCSCFGCTSRQEIPGIGVQIIERRQQLA